MADMVARVEREEAKEVVKEAEGSEVAGLVAGGEREAVDAAAGAWAATGATVEA